MDIYYFDGLICTSVKITFNGNTTIIDNVVIDTGAVESILSSNVVKNIGIKINTTDKTAVTRGAGGSKMRFFYKIIDEIEIGATVFQNIKIDFGNIDPSGEINGLIGLDLLRSLHAVIDIDVPFIYLKKE
ncbi:MAG: retroviral-like aspartic protease family protein [Clostridiaceae bacterium]|nr:retroviral-like aspartic protease family protein [Clostridiaceae bacterium]